MFSQLKSVVDVIRTAVTDFRKFKSSAEREKVVVDLLKTYFVLKDVVDDGESLILEAGINPVETIERLDAKAALATLERWDLVIRNQGLRFYYLQGRIFADDHLAVLSPDFQDRISDLIGYKMDRAVTLHGIGSALYIRSIIPIPDTNAEKARYVALMAGAEDDVLDPVALRSEIAALREGLDQYRQIVERLVSNDEVLRLSARARKETLHDVA